MGYWTDVAKEHGLMPAGGGLRNCKCGHFYLLLRSNLDLIDVEAETPHTEFVDAAGVHIKLPISTRSQKHDSYAEL